MVVVVVGGGDILLFSGTLPAVPVSSLLLACLLQAERSSSPASLLLLVLLASFCCCTPFRSVYAYVHEFVTIRIIRTMESIFEIQTCPSDSLAIRNATITTHRKHETITRHRARPRPAPSLLGLARKQNTNGKHTTQLIPRRKTKALLSS